MIKLINDLVVKVDANNYTLMEDIHAVDKEGKDIYKPISYHDNLEKAIRGAMRYMVRKRLQEGERTLTEAINAIKEVNKEFEELLNKDIEGYEN